MFVTNVSLQVISNYIDTLLLIKIRAYKKRERKRERFFLGFYIMYIYYKVYFFKYMFFYEWCNMGITLIRQRITA